MCHPSDCRVIAKTSDSFHLAQMGMSLTAQGSLVRIRITSPGAKPAMALRVFRIVLLNNRMGISSVCPGAAAPDCSCCKLSVDGVGVFIGRSP